jgi:hypothetical protein
MRGRAQRDSQALEDKASGVEFAGHPQLPIDFPRRCPYNRLHRSN